MKSSTIGAALFLALLAAVVVVIELVRIPNLYEVEGAGVVKFHPDAARLTVGAYFESDQSGDAIGQTATVMHNILDALKGAGVNDDDIVTKAVTSGPRVDDHSTTATPTPKPIYYADQEVIATVHDTSRIAKLLDVITAAGSNSWEVTYFASNPAKLEADAHRAAFADALRRADVLAEGGGFRRGAVLKITEGSATFPGANYAERNYVNTYLNLNSERVTVTGSRLPPRRVFAVPPPQDQTVTASVGVLFEIK